MTKCSAWPARLPTSTHRTRFKSSTWPRRSITGCWIAISGVDQAVPRVAPKCQRFKNTDRPFIDARRYAMRSMRPQKKRHGNYRGVSNVSFASIIRRVDGLTWQDAWPLSSSAATPQPGLIKAPIRSRPCSPVALQLKGSSQWEQPARHGLQQRRGPHFLTWSRGPTLPPHKRSG